uniref:Uncharacterized protein n=1 Tax=Arundo donax TaxID=35708 RepID=A0A0A9HGY3_ARUDO
MSIVTATSMHYHPANGNGYESEQIKVVSTNCTILEHRNVDYQPANPHNL